MGSVPSEFIDDIKRIVQSVLNQLEGLKVRWLHGVDKINDAEWSAVNYGVTVCTSTTRPTAYDGRPIYETDTNTFLIYNGSSWVASGGTGTDHSVLTNLNWAAAGHTIDGNIDMNDNDITEANAIQATASQDLTLKVSTGQSIVFQAV